MEFEVTNRILLDAINENAELEERVVELTEMNADLVEELIEVRSMLHDRVFGVTSGANDLDAVDVQLMARALQATVSLVENGVWPEWWRTGLDGVFSVLRMGMRDA